MGFVVDKAELRRAFSEYFGFPYPSFYRLLHTHHPSSGAGTVGQTVADVPRGLNLTPTRKYKKNPWAVMLCCLKK
jgi:hypothetical protein